MDGLDFTYDEELESRKYMGWLYGPFGMETQVFGTLETSRTDLALSRPTPAASGSSGTWRTRPGTTRSPPRPSVATSDQTLATSFRLKTMLLTLWQFSFKRRFLRGSRFVIRG